MHLRTLQSSASLSSLAFLHSRSYSFLSYSRQVPFTYACEFGKGCGVFKDLVGVFKERAHASANLQVHEKIL